MDVKHATVGKVSRAKVTPEIPVRVTRIRTTDTTYGKFINKMVTELFVRLSGLWVSRALKITLSTVNKEELIPIRH